MFFASRNGNQFFSMSFWEKTKWRNVFTFVSFVCQFDTAPVTYFWKFSFHCLSFFGITANGLALGAVADFGAQNFNLITKVDASYNVQLTTSPAIEPNAC